MDASSSPAPSEASPPRSGDSASPARSGASSTGPAAPPSGRDDVDVLATAERWLDEGRGVALATVLATWGSAPRPTGSHLAVNDRREFVGSVSGGCVEGAVIQAAAEVIASGEPRTLEFGVTNEEAWAVGLSCGGRIRVYVESVA